MPDDSRLREYARKHGLTFCWKTWREDAHWHAEARTWRDGKHHAWFGTSTMEGEQAALDGAIHLLMFPPRGPRHEDMRQRSHREYN